LETLISRFNGTGHRPAKHMKQNAKQNEHQNAQPLRELEWLAHYFKEHCREDLAQQIFKQVKILRQRAQDSIPGGGNSDVLDFCPESKKKSGTES